jgi:hypothetical protein
VVELVPVDYDPFADEKGIFDPRSVKAAIQKGMEGGPQKVVGAIVQEPRRIIEGLTTLPKRAIESAAEDVQHRGESDRTVLKSAAPAAETALLTMGMGGKFFKPVDHDPFAPTAHDPKLAQFERLEKKGAPENITRQLTGFYRDETGTVRKWGEKPEAEVIKPKVEIVKPEVKTVRVETSRVEPKAKEQIYLPKLVVHEKAQPEFVRSIYEYHDKLPGAAKKILHERASQVFAAEKLTDSRPDLIGVRPRGWPAGTSWDMAEGCAHAGNVFIARTKFDRFSGEFVPSTRIEGAYNHESGHALDFLMDRASQGQKFLSLYNRDRNKILLADEKMAHLAYFVQKGEAGPSEAFAELFAQIVGPGSSYYRIGPHFPHTEPYMKDLLATWRK